MKRLHLFEFEDLAWFPSVFRNLVTDFIKTLARVLRLYDQVVPLIEKVLVKVDSKQIIDLCSGGSGPWSHLANHIGNEANIILTDRYPNVSAFENTKANSGNKISFMPKPIDATDVPEHLKGMRTIFTAFHHFRPDMAKAILTDAVKKNTAIGIFEYNERRWHSILFAPIYIPLMVFVLTPFIKPFKISRIFWTYCIPVAPLIILWDGLVSFIRTYSVEELKELVSTIDSPNYHWEISKQKSLLPGTQIIYLLGYPIVPVENKNVLVKTTCQKMEKAARQPELVS